LLNALLGEDRAIVTAVAGTTRDTIEESADFDGVPVVLSDTAGLRETARAGTVERLGIERTSAKIAQAQLLLKVLDAAAPLEEEDVAVLNAAAGIPHVIVLNKIDLPQIISDQDVLRLVGGGPILSVSATERQGLPALRQAVIRQFFNGDAPAADAPVLSNVRHRDALQKALGSLALARESITDGRPADLVAVDVQDAIDHIGAITGQVTSEDVLDKIFSEFCVGK
jgi:tRNA modification GTPase